MAVPDTNTFNLINVTDEFGLGDGDSLQDCFNDSSAGDFDGDYNPNSDGGNNNLLNFRNHSVVPPIIITEDTYFKVIFDKSGSMELTENRLKRDFQGDGVPNPYTDRTCLKSYMQDFYATGATQSSGNTDTATNGSDQYNARFSVWRDSSENPFFQLNNVGYGFESYTLAGADNVVIMPFLDESSSIGNPDDSYPCVNTLPNSSAMLALTDLKASINAFANNYTGICFFVDYSDLAAGDGLGAIQTFDDALTSSISSRFNYEFNSLDPYYYPCFIGNPAGSDYNGYALINDGDTTSGYYTKIVVDSLREHGFNIAPYDG